MEDTTTEVKEEEKKQPPKGMKRTIGAIIGVIILCGVGYFVHDA